MSVRTISPLTFCITGLSWLVFGAILGMVTLIGLVHGTPPPSWVRALHVHATLVGGVAQIMLGGFLFLIPPPGSRTQKGTDSHPLPFWAMNGGLFGMLVGFWLHRNAVVGAGGVVVMIAFLSIISVVWTRASRTWRLSFKESWYYALSLFCLVGGAACGGIMALEFAPASYGYVRLAHIHLTVIGFIVLAIIGMIHHLLPTIWTRPHVNPGLARIGMIVIPVGVAVLIGGFLNSSISIALASGGILFIGGLLWASTLFRTWFSSSPPGSAASDHLLVSTFFLLFTIILGILVGVNNLSSPSRLPYGKLHLVAYTHMTFFGFIINALMGGCSYYVPLSLAVTRVPNAKKRSTYLDHLRTMMNRWRTIQIATLSLGTMGLGLLAALTWNVPLTSVYIRVATWTSLVLFMTGLTIFTVKLTSILAKKPDTLRPRQMSADDLKLMV